MTHPSVNSIVERLEPCPFCGPQQRVYLNAPNEHDRYGSINCPACMVVMPGAVSDQAELIQCWNNRPAATIISELQAERVDKATAWGAVAEKNAEIADLRSRIKRLSDALLAARPLGGSELFVRWGDGFHADPEFFKDALERDKARYHEAMKRAVTAEKKLATAESSLSRIKAETIEAVISILSAKDTSAPVHTFRFGDMLAKTAEGDTHFMTKRDVNRLFDERIAAIRSLGSTGGAEKTAESDHSPSTPTTATE